VIEKMRKDFHSPYVLLQWHKMYDLWAMQHEAKPKLACEVLFKTDNRCGRLTKFRCLDLALDSRTNDAAN